MKEKSLGSMSGIPTLLGALLLMLVGSVAIIGAIIVTKNGTGGGGMLVIGGILLVIVGIIFSCGLYMVQPNQAAVISLFGKYVGTVKETACAVTIPSTASVRSACACVTSRAASSRSTSWMARRSRSPR